MSPSDSAERLAREIGGLGLSGSAASEADLDLLVNAALERWGRIDAVVNSTGLFRTVLSKFGVDMGGATAGKLTYDPDNDFAVDTLPDAAWHDALDTFFLNVVRMCRLVTPVMRKHGGGSIVNISSVDAFEPCQAYPPGPVRAALQSFSKLYADRYGREGIRINTVAPGMLESTKLSPDDVRETIPLGRLGQPRDIAHMVAFLLSDEASYVSGQFLRVDGALNRAV